MLIWCQKNHAAIIDLVRELAGGNLLQMPINASVFDDATLREQFEAYYATPFLGATERMKLLKLAWDFIGSEFAGRHLLYEKFYTGTSFLERNQNFREAPWDNFHAIVDNGMANLPPDET